MLLFNVSFKDWLGAKAFFLFGRSLAKGLGRAFRSYLFARDLSKRITAAIPNAAPVAIKLLASFSNIFVSD